MGLLGGVEIGARKYGNSRPVLRSTAFQGVPISVEIEAGEHVVGNGWEKTYVYPYGEIPNSATLADGEGVDVYIGPDPLSDLVVVVHQNKRDGSYDEDKVLLGFGSERDAVDCYFHHGPEWGFGSTDTMTVDQFRNGYLAANRPEMAGGERGVIPIAVALIIAGAVLISGFMIAYKPQIHCSVGQKGGEFKYNGDGSKIVPMQPVFGTFDRSMLQLNNQMTVGGR